MTQTREQIGRLVGNVCHDSWHLGNDQEFSGNKEKAVASKAALMSAVDALIAERDEWKTKWAQSHSQAIANGADAAFIRADRDALLSRLAESERDAAAKQARIDALMLEWCPQEMTPEQVAEWERNQVPVDAETKAAIDLAISQELGEQG